MRRMIFISSLGSSRVGNTPSPPPTCCVEALVRVARETSAINVVHPFGAGALTAAPDVSPHSPKISQVLAVLGPVVGQYSILELGDALGRLAARQRLACGSAVAQRGASRGGRGAVRVEGGL